MIGLFGTLTLANGRYPFSEDARLFVMLVSAAAPPHFLHSACKHLTYCGRAR